MLLAIDVGNTNTVFAVFKGDELLHSWRCMTLSDRSADEYAAFLNELFSLARIDWAHFGSVIISSVVPDADFQLSVFCESYIKCSPVFVKHDILSLVVDMDNPSEVGADRLVNAVAVSVHYSFPAIVIDFGTATTFDVIDAEGAYAGGVIAPGVNLSIEALGRAAAKLPQVSIQKPQKTIGKNTIEAIQSGIFWGYTGLIEGIIARLKNEIEGEPVIIATGGLAALFSSHLNIIDQLDEDLTLKGLLQIHKDIS